jgi:hypothetical protein
VASLLFSIGLLRSFGVFFARFVISCWLPLVDTSSARGLAVLIWAAIIQRFKRGTSEVIPSVGSRTGSVVIGNGE